MSPFSHLADCGRLLGLVFVSAFLVAPTNASGQLTGRVMDSEGRGIEAATVELRSGSEVLQRVWTDSLGDFRFSTAGAKSLLAVTRLGYSPAELQVSERLEPLVITLADAPVVLDALVAVARSPCPGEEQATARQVWNRARSRYADDTSARSIRYSVRYLEEDQIPESALSVIDRNRLKLAGRAHVGSTSVPTSGRYLDINVLIRSHGYAEKTRLSNRKWRINRLDGRHAHHFLSAAFGRRHTLAMATDNDGGFIVTFCPRTRDEVEIEGVLHFGSDYALLSADWTYDAERLGVESGGEATFMEVVPDGEIVPHLVPATSQFWQESTDWPGYFFRRASIFVKWTIDSEGL